MYITRDPTKSRAEAHNMQHANKDNPESTQRNKARQGKNTVKQRIITIHAHSSLLALQQLHNQRQLLPFREFAFYCWRHHARRGTCEVLARWDGEAEVKEEYGDECLDFDCAE